MSTRIRTATTDDIDSLWTLAAGFGLVLADGRAPAHPESADIARLGALLRDTHQLLLVAEHEAGLVGYALAQDYGVSLRRDWSVARLHDLYVTPAARHLGVGRELHRAVVAWCARRPVRFLEWQASTSAIDFYVTLGYSPDWKGDYADHPLFEHDFTRE